MQLDDGVTYITLPNSLEWVDEFSWSSVEQDQQRTSGGSLIIHERTLTKGRPFTFVGGENVWVNRSVVVDLMAFVNAVDKTLTLTMPDGTTTYDVMFNRESQPLEATPVWRKNIQEDTDKYTLTIRLMEV